MIIAALEGEISYLLRDSEEANRSRAERAFGPKGFQSLRVHDLKHTFGHRLRAAGIGFEDRKVLLGHKSDHVTTHYSAPEIGTLVAAAERVCELGSRKSHALSLVRGQQAAVSN